MPRFYCPTLAPPPATLTGDAEFLSLDNPAGLVTLDSDEAHHARRVLRLEPGETVDLFNGRGGTARGILESWSSGATVRVTDYRHVPPLRPVLDMAVAIPKGPRADEMVNQLSQLGVDRLIPLLTERGVVDPRPGKLEKWRRIAVESAKQCGRAWLMEVIEPTTLGEALRASHDLRLLSIPTASKPERIEARLRSKDRVLVLIGPEGGWTPSELDDAEGSGAVGMTLGPHVLRIETAALAAAAILRYAELSCE